MNIIPNLQGENIMKNKLGMNFAVCLAVVFIFGATIVARQALDSGKGAVLQNDLNRQDDFPESPCERFPKDQVFDNFQQALRTPEKVRCLDPNVEGEVVKMKRLPNGFGKLVNLEVLSLSCLEELEELPEEIGNFKKLRELIIDNGNGCSMNVTLPRSLGKLENLRVLRLYGALDAGGVADNQNSRQPKIKTLPDTIGNLKRLEVLDLGRNNLKIVPPQIASLTQLKTLRLEYNELRALPAFIGNFKNLKELSLDANRKVSLPASLANVPGLKVSMGNNSLRLTEQKVLRSRFPKIVFSFENEYEDDSANEQPRKSKPQPRRKG
jgi:Leucine-rich repeat (LRR) protein